MGAVTSQRDRDFLDGGAQLGDPWQGVDREALARAVREQSERPVPGVDDMASYLAAQVSDTSHREVVGPLLAGQGASGVVVRRGVVIASWGDPAREEMAYSVTKSALSLVAGVAFDDGLLRLDEPVSTSVDLPQFADAHGRAITWRHLLDQTSQWEGELWGKPTRVDAQSTREGTESPGGPPGEGWHRRHARRPRQANADADREARLAAQLATEAEATDGTWRGEWIGEQADGALFAIERDAEQGALFA
ncbi:beta-lactamase family protein [Streptomyces himalayensis]|uniref:beta-lactamase family protein n=1 Tax=Streptomyces himalayensis TaxID=2820085 RepID=UPI00215DA250|nr:beta-lactamase family protein [Streptomyces himalayensis]